MCVGVPRVVALAVVIARVLFDIVDLVSLRPLVCVLGAFLLRQRGLVLQAGHLLHPGPEAAHPGVERGRGGVAAAVAPGDHPGERPPPRLALAHQASSGVALATVAVEEAGVRGAACAQRAVAGEAVAVALLALPRRHERNPGGDDGV